VHNDHLNDTELNRLARRFAAAIPGAVGFEDTRQLRDPEAFRMLYREFPQGHGIGEALGQFNQVICSFPDDPVVMVEGHLTEFRVILVGLAYQASILDIGTLQQFPEVHAVGVSATPAYAGRVMELFVPGGLSQALESKIRDSLKL
jgi:hypothetical protein